MKAMIITSIIIVLITIGSMIVAISTPIMTTIGIAMFVYQNISSVFGNHSCFPKPATQIHPLKRRLKATEDAPFEQQAECQEAVCEAAQGAEGHSLPWNVGKGYRKNGTPQEMPNNASGCW